MKNLIVGILIGSALTGLAAKAIDVQLQFDVRDLYVASLLGSNNLPPNYDDKVNSAFIIADKCMSRRKIRQ